MHKPIAEGTVKNSTILSPVAMLRRIAERFFAGELTRRRAGI